MLTSVDCDRPLLGDARTDAISPLDRLGPHAAEPRSPIFKPARIVLVATVFDGDTGRVAEQDRVPCFANHLVESINLLLCTQDQLVQRFPKPFELMRHQNSRSFATVDVDAVFVRGALPGG